VETFTFLWQIYSGCHVRLPDTSAARHIGSIAEVSIRHIGSAAEVSGHFDSAAEVSQDTSVVLTSCVLWTYKKCPPNYRSNLKIYLIINFVRINSGMYHVEDYDITKHFGFFSVTRCI